MVIWSYNRYSYCWNNPLKYTDPSGYVTIDIDGLQFNINNIKLFNRFLSDNWLNFTSVQSQGWSLSWGDMSKMYKAELGSRGDQKGFWYYSYYWDNHKYSEEKNVEEDEQRKKELEEEGFADYSVNMSKWHFSATFFALDDGYLDNPIDYLFSEKVKNIMTYGVGSISFALSYSRLRYSPPTIISGGTWRGVNKKIYQWKILDDKNNPAWGLFKNSKEIAAQRTIVWRSIGKGVGYIGLLYSGVNFLNDQSLSNGIDLSASAISIIVPEVGFFYVIGSASYYNTLNTYENYVENGRLNSFNPSEGLLFEFSTHGKE